jgi:hypothetical protein
MNTFQFGSAGPIMTEREVIIQALTRVYGEGKPPQDQYDSGLTWSSTWQRQFPDTQRLDGLSVYDGYSCFVSSFEFDKDGDLIRCAAWE